MSLSPMMQQYMQIKSSHRDHILFFRLGDFYEMFFEDAELASKELELTLTGRECGLEERAPMCGVPYHSCEAYIARLIKKGYKVAICEQMEDPKASKGMVRREVVRVVTPGTLVETNLLEEGVNNFIASVYLGEGDCYGLAMADISTGEIHATELTDGGDDQLKNELARFAPSEIVFNPAFLSKGEIAAFLRERISCVGECMEDAAYASADEKVSAHFGGRGLSVLELEEKPLAVLAIMGLLKYLHRTQMTGVDRLVTLGLYSSSQFMKLDITARRNLELTETMRTKEKKGSLLWVIDRTKTAMGKRLLRRYLEQPLVSPAVIDKRLNAVEELHRSPILREEIRDTLAHVYDLERLMTKIVFGSSTPRELKSLEFTLRHLPALKGLLQGCHSAFLGSVENSIDPLQDIADQIEAAITDKDTPNTLKDGWIIREGYHQELDKIRELVTHTKDYLTRIEREEKERTGIKSLKIGYNKVFGYYIEVTRSNLAQVPDNYIRKQTLAGAERYITEELKTLEERILTASERMLTLEVQLFGALRERIAAELPRIQETANAVARLDVFASLAQVAQDNNYCRPEVNFSGEIAITDGRHPVVELLLGGAPFVSNDLHLNLDDDQVAVITGPNMAGKSTFMRQSALIVILAQMGSFVPAAQARIGVVDGIFTRVGAADDLSTGQSTFMVEMSEVADILKYATNRSLLILDEMGRGTSTFDGMSIARAVIEYIADKRKLGAKTLFATHYHELTALEDTVHGVKNYNVAVKKRGEEITFLRKIVRGGADDSYGIEVSKLAGIPDSIVKRAFVILESLEGGQPVSAPKKRGVTQGGAAQESGQLSMLPSSQVEEALRQIDVNTLTPIEALNKLYELKSQLSV